MLKQLIAAFAVLTVGTALSGCAATDTPSAAIASASQNRIVSDTKPGFPLVQSGVGSPNDFNWLAGGD